MANSNGEAAVRWHVSPLQRLRLLCYQERGGEKIQACSSRWHDGSSVLARLSGGGAELGQGSNALVMVCLTRGPLVKYHFDLVHISKLPKQTHLRPFLNCIG